VLPGTAAGATAGTGLAGPFAVAADAGRAGVRAMAAAQVTPIEDATEDEGNPFRRMLLILYIVRQICPIGN
jgi:hypothetical protein